MKIDHQQLWVYLMNVMGSVFSCMLKLGGYMTLRDLGAQVLKGPDPLLRNCV